MKNAVDTDVTEINRRARQFERDAAARREAKLQPARDKRKRQKAEAEYNAAEVAKLVEFFRGDGYSRFGWDGDTRGWSPADTAIAAMRELMRQEPTP